MKSQTRAGLGCPPHTSSPGTPDRQRHLWARLSHSRGFIASVRKGGGVREVGGSGEFLTGGCGAE